MAGFQDFMNQRKQQNIGSGTNEPLDMGEGTRPRLTFQQYMAQKEGPQVSEQTIKDVTARPVGRPTGSGEQPQPQPTAPQQAPQGDSELDEPWYKKLGSAALGAAEAVVSPSLAISKFTQEHPEETMDWARTEALPTIGGLAVLAAPETGGLSMLGAMSLEAALAGTGAAAGEAIEQTAKLKGWMQTGKGETAPKDGWDVLERAGTRGAEEAAWQALPDILTRGMPIAARKLLMTGGKGAVDEAGNVVNIGKKELVETMKDYAQRKGLQMNQTLLASDVAEVPLLDMAESISSNSYFAGSKIADVRAAQAEAIKEKITSTAGQYMEPAKGYVNDTTDAAIKRYVEPNMKSMNDFAVAGLVNVGFKKAQEAQKSVARSIYRTIGDSMEATTMRPVYKEIELPLLGPDGRPMTTMVNTTEEVPAFPVDLTGVKDLAEKRAEESLTKLDADHAEMLGLPDSTDYKKAANTLTEWKATSRQLERATTEGAPVRKLHLDRAINALEKSMDDALNAAHDAGISAPDGRSLAEFKGDADAIWKEQVEDFQNSYLMNIIKNTNPKNGAPDKLGRLFMQNETAAHNIMKVLDDGKASLKGEDLEQLTQAENAIKGSIVEELFMPFDKASGKYMAPDVAPVHAKKEELSRIFGDDGYKELSNLAAMIQEQGKVGTSNFLGFAQRARESGMLLSTVKGFLKGEKSIVGPLISDGGSTVLFALGMGRILTNPRTIAYAATLADPRVPEYIKIGAFRNIAQKYVQWHQLNTDSMDDTERERAEAQHSDNKEYNQMIQGMNAQ